MNPPEPKDGESGRTDVPQFSGRDAADELFGVAYQELLRMARGVKSGEVFAELSTRTLLHETYLKLAAYPRFKALSEAHLMHIVRGAMREVLIDTARRRRAAKRTGKTEMLDSDIPTNDDATNEFIARSDALDLLATLAPRQASVIESRYFFGRTIAETASTLGVSASTVKSDERIALAWLQTRLAEWQ